MSAFGQLCLQTEVLSRAWEFTGLLISTPGTSKYLCFCRLTPGFTCALTHQCGIEVPILFVHFQT